MPPLHCADLQYAGTHVWLASQISPLSQSGLTTHPTHTPFLVSQIAGQSLLLLHGVAATHLDSTHAWLVPQSLAVLQSTHTLQAVLQTWLVALHCMSDVQETPLTHLCCAQYAPPPQSLEEMQPTHAFKLVSQMPTLQSMPPPHGTRLVGTQPEIALCTQPPTQLSAVQSSPSSQLMGLPPLQVLFAQIPAPVQASPSSQLALFAVWMQPPEPHESSVHGLLSVQFLMSGTCVQPLTGSQLSMVQAIPSSQPTSLPPVQVPLPQVSPLVQALPSSQLPVLGTLLQIPALHPSFVQEFLSSQLLPAR